MKKVLIVLFMSLIICPVSYTAFAQEIRATPEELVNWSFYGEGFVLADAKHQQIVMAETPGSKGVMLVSPASYQGDVVVSYEVRPLTPESVLVVLLSASDKGDLSSISFPTGYNGNMQYLITDLDNYFIAYHNASHNNAPVIRRYPQKLPGKIELAGANENVMTTAWHTVETGKRSGKIWLKINGKTVVEAADEKILEAGHVILRMRGTKNRIGVCLIKNVTIQVGSE